MKDEIAKRIVDKYLHRFVAAFNVGGHHEREHARLTAMLLEALTEYEALREPVDQEWADAVGEKVLRACASAGWGQSDYSRAGRVILAELGRRK